MTHNNSINRLLLPISLSIIGLGCLVVTGILAYRELISNEDDLTEEIYNEGIENYDVVKGKPVIFGMAE
ncbi:MAG: hypothetical protein SGJ04_02365 [Bacteroidota bacterium]|nr:hypothetical protein [Bacteroidota bacterium]